MSGTIPLEHDVVLTRDDYTAKLIFIKYVWPVLAFILVIAILPFFLPISLIFRFYRNTIKDRILHRTQGQAVLVEHDDAVWFLDSRENMSIINSLMLLKGKPDVEKWQKAMFDRIVDVRDGDGVKMFPKMSCYATKMYGRDVWIKVRHYDVKDNCYLWDKSVPKSKTELESLLGYICSQPFPEKKALWQMILVPSGNRMEDFFYAVMRVHHAVGDGVSLSKVIMTRLVDVPIEEVTASRFGSKGRFLRMMKAVFTGPAMLMERLAWPATKHIFHGAKLSGDKVVAWSEQIDLNMVKKMKNVAGCTVNDILFACLSLAFRAHFKKHSIDIPESILAYVPVDIRAKSDKLVLDNQFALVFFQLPLRVEEPLDCVKEVKRRMDIIKNSAEPVVNAVSITYCMARLPGLFNRWLFDSMSDKCSMVLSNVPGPTEKVFICSNPLEDMIFWPPQRASVGMYIRYFIYYYYSLIDKKLIIWVTPINLFKLIFR